MHSRTQYLADSDDSARQPLLQDSGTTAPEYPVLQSAAEPPTSGKSSNFDTPSAPPLNKASIEAGPSGEQQAPTNEYGLPTGYQAQYAEGPPASGSLQPSVQNMGQLAQPTQQSYRMQLLGSFDDEPAVVTCSQCGVTGQTYTVKESGCCVWFSALSCLFMGCWPCAWLPFCVGSCKDTVHKCSSCGTILGKHAWGR
ncbi:TPA: hypothetical protein ACH3X1_013171 [Trebouxia sp. C0004]